MADYGEPMDVDGDFDNKENSYHHSNVQPCTEKGYEELDVSELNMKLRYSVTPSSSPMSKSYTANCVDNRVLDSSGNSIHVNINENANLTRSLNASLSKNDSMAKSFQSLPLQTLPPEPVDRTTCVLRPLDTSITPDINNGTIIITGPIDNDYNLSVSSSSSSNVQTPDATTPTKEIPKSDGGSPIMRGLKSVLNMFRSSQSPIPPESEELSKQELSPDEATSPKPVHPAVTASTPIVTHHKKETSPTKKSSPHKESIVFNDDLEKELEWKDETTIIFSHERIPIHKLFLQQAQPAGTTLSGNVGELKADEDLNSTVEYMDISCNDSILQNKTLEAKADKSEHPVAVDSDGEFVDCETTLTKDESYVIDVNNVTQGITHNLNANRDVTKNNSKLKQIILNTTQDILDAMLSITPEDLNKTNAILDTVSVPENCDISENRNLCYELNETVRIQDQTLELDNSSKQLNDNTKIIEEIENKSNKNNDRAIFQTTESDITPKLIDTNIVNEFIENTQNTDSTSLEKSTFHNLNVTNVIESSLGKKLESVDSIGVVDNTDLIAIKSVELINNETLKLDIKNNSVDPSQITENTPFKSKFEQSVVNFKESPNNIRILESSLGENLSESPASKNNDATDLIHHDIAAAENNMSKEDIIHQDGEAIKNIDNASTQSLHKENPDPRIEITSQAETTQNNETVDGSILENNNVITEREFSIDQCELNLINDTDKNIETIASEIVPATYSLDDKSHSNLPADIPLPEEDDIDKEVLVEKSTPDLVDNILINAVDAPIPIFDRQESILYGEINNQQNFTSSEVKPEAEITLNKSKNDNNTQTFIPSVEATGTSYDNTTNIGLLENINEVKLLDNSPNESVPPEPMDTIENVIDIKSLPDVINQIITDGQDNIKHETNIPLLVRNDDELKAVSYSLGSNLNEEKPATTSAGLAEHTGNDTVNMSIDFNETREILKDDLILDSASVINNAVTATENLDNAVFLSKEDAVEIIEKEVVIGNNSPFVFVTAENLGLDEKPMGSKDSIENTNEIEIDRMEDTEDQQIISSEGNLEKDNEDNNMPIEHVNSDHIEKTIPVATENNVENGPNPLHIKIQTPPASPPISSKGYNFNFDDAIDQNIQTSIEKVEVNKTDKEPIIISPHQLMGNNDVCEQSTKLNTNLSKTSPASPPISSKGYNFNFDEIENPFATQSDIKLPPTPRAVFESKECCKFQDKPAKIKKDSRRKSQPERKKPLLPKKNLNSSFDYTLNMVANDKPEDIKFNVDDEIKENISDPVIALAHPNTSNSKGELSRIDIIDNMIEKVDTPELDIHTENSIEMESIDEKKWAPIEKSRCENPTDLNSLNALSCEDSANEVKNPSPSEQSTYVTPGTSSCDSFKSRNVFNIPEIEDMNFNPFATKSKVRQSPPPMTDNPFATVCKIKKSAKPSIDASENYSDNMKHIIEQNLLLSEDKIETELMEKTSSDNLSNITSSSKATDEKDATFREVNTEDEDTIEGPFLETEDLLKEDKILDFGNKNINTKGANQEAGEMFIDAEAFEFLLNQNKSSTVADSGKESLFLKFDPLFSKRISSDGVLAALNSLQRKQSTPTKVTKVSSHEVGSPVAGPSNLNITHDMDLNTSQELNDELNVTVAKPMMVVPPAVNPSVTPRNKSITPTRSNRRSLIFTSPAMAAIDSILALSGNNRTHDLTHVSREQAEAEAALTQLRELLAEKEVDVYNLRSENQELRDTLSNLESQVKCLEIKNQDKLKKINDLNDTLVKKTHINKSMAGVVEEYERTIGSLIAESEQEKKQHAEERLRLISERDEQTAHLGSMEVSFNDIHSKYEKSKQLILTCKANEEKYMKSIKEFEENLTKMMSNYELLKQHATSKLNHANQELEKINKAHEAEILKLNAMIKRKDLHISSLEESLMQKTKANEELTSICDELINKVG